MSAPVDVLAVMEKAALYAEHANIAALNVPRIGPEELPGQTERAFQRIAVGLAPMEEGRAAVAELVEAADGGRNESFGRIVFDEAQATRLRAALARVRGAA